MRHLTLLSLAVVACLAIVGQPAVADAVNLIQNGDFESMVPSNGAGNFWTTSNIDGSGGWRATGGNPATSGTFILNAAGELASDPTAQQSVSGLIVGATYSIQGDVACGNVCPSPQTISEASFGVLVDGVAIFERLTTSSTTTWAHFAPTFTATSTTQVIGFAGERNGTDFDPRIDNISLECVQNCGAATVPEPTTVFLLGAGVVGLARISRRRRA